MKQHIASRIIYLSVASAILFATAMATAQHPIRHELIRGDMPPGLAADYSRMRNPSFARHVQPVRVISPLGSRVHIANQDGFRKTNSARVSVGMTIGPVYRFKISNIPQHLGKEVFPSIEILDRLHPPEGLENEFPIEVVISEDDLKQAIAGRLVTKVIYLENPETTLPHRHRANEQPYIDVGGGTDPLRAAEKLGRPMAILRMGSRIPMPSDLIERFNFGAPATAVLPDPQTVRSEPKVESDAQPAIKKPSDPNTPKATDRQSSTPTSSRVASRIPNTIESANRVGKASHDSQDEINLRDQTGSGTRKQLGSAFPIAYPTPLGYGKNVYRAANQKPGSKMSTPGFNKWHPNAGRDEYVFDGNDRGEKVHVDQSWKVHGLQTEDTVGHFDTLDGRRIVTPSNRVAIYAPRFGAVRKLDAVFNARLNSPVIALEELTPIARAAGKDESSTTKQHVALNRFDGAKRASGFVDRTRGVATGTVVHLFGVRNSFKAFENLQLIRIGKFSNAESARLNLGMLSARVWEDNLGLQVVTKKVALIIVNDVRTAQEFVRVESEDGSAILRVTKVASKIAARTGELVDFTIRFDNLSGKKIGNVTIIDNLTRRLEFVPNSAESSLKADFISEQNDGGSLMLRWEITEPVEAHSGGIIRFQCRVR